MLEIERKYLIPATLRESVISAYSDAEHHIVQGYLAFDGTECRVRQKTPILAPPRSWITFKQGAGVERLELEREIPNDFAAQLLQLAAPYVVTKTRYDVGRWEIDFFADDASPPIAEVELGCVKEVVAFPEFDGGKYDLREVTNDPAYLNRNIALRVGSEQQAAAGYHLRHIPKGILGEVSKLREELEELEDATIQRNRILQLVELSDLYGAMEHLVVSYGLEMSDLASMAHATRRAFAVGVRA